MYVEIYGPKVRELRESEGPTGRMPRPRAPGPWFCRERGGAVQDDKWRRYFTVEEAAERLGLSRPKAYQMVARGQLRSLKIGGVVRVLRDALLPSSRAEDGPCDSQSFVTSD
jgi:excisionase family DNA binding protein